MRKTRKFEKVDRQQKSIDADVPSTARPLAKLGIKLCEINFDHILMFKAQLSF